MYYLLNSNVSVLYGNAWAGRFVALTNGIGSVADVAPSITISIASPLDGETVSKPDVTVKRAVINTTGNEIGVSVNGVVATMYGDQFIVTHVPLIEGANTITVTATDTAGTTATKSITVNAVATGNYIRVTSNIESGIAPLEVTLRIDGLFSIDNSNLSVTGPTAIELLDNPSPDEYRVRIIAEGVYTFTANVTGHDGNTYQDTIVVTVMNKKQLDTLLKAKWEGMKTALMSGNIDKALSYIAGTSRNMFGYNFELMKDYLSTILQDMGNITVKTIEGRVAEYEMLATQDGLEKSFYIIFVKDADGVWRISFF